MFGEKTINVNQNKTEEKPSVKNLENPFMLLVFCGK